MGREVKRIDERFKWFETEKNERGHTKTWFGYLLDSFAYCQCCKGEKVKGENCPLCWGEGYIHLCIEPPEGDGWQMWENTSEGSPISPVCKTPEELAKWLADNYASAMGSQTSTEEEWLAMIGQGFAPSGVMMGGVMKSGVAAAKDLNK